MKKTNKFFSTLFAITISPIILCSGASCLKGNTIQPPKNTPSYLELKTNLNTDCYTTPIISHAQKKNQLIKAAFTQLAKSIIQVFSAISPQNPAQ